jgi:hypothetical protein
MRSLRRYVDSGATRAVDRSYDAAARGMNYRGTPAPWKPMKSQNWKNIWQEPPARCSSGSHTFQWDAQLDKACLRD